ncbi:MAG TPA: adenylyltransferase/cytidyltransferase family protein [bacterium]|nr:adenylyltransferase/cytidyltransferase family protein [bacterium]
MRPEEYFKDKIKSLDELVGIVKDERARGKRIGLANGCFDIIHVGHVRYLKGAKEHADILIVGINSDESVRKLKGGNRPYISEQERMWMIAAIEYVDYVTVFGDTRVDNLLLKIKPDFHAKGTDYTKDTVPEKEIVASYGGDILITGDPKEHSSTSVIEKIRAKKG